MSDAYARGRRMGVDVGLVRVGVALCDPDGILATPLTTLRRDPRKGFDVKLLAGLVQEHDVVAVYVGLPRSLDGGENASTAMARDYAEALVRRLRAKGRDDVPVRLVDERLSTVDAHRALLEAGVSRRDHMDKVDQVAAATILQSAVDRAKATGAEPGAPVDPPVPGAADSPVAHNGDDHDGQGPVVAHRGEPSTGAGSTAEDTAEDTAGAPDRARTAPLTTTDPDGEHS
ncbi:Holliday junction resolvase RuvX [Kocuria aegyptia]|uniref:Putative pre-16S rRNA nuclease n=1 Tax=Kocuria aegyptia TaxID=330943 RepID=A0ABP4WJ17_9MICC